MNKGTKTRLKSIVDGKVKEVLDEVQIVFRVGNHEEEARLLVIQLAHYVTTVRKGDVVACELDAVCDLCKACCQALEFENLSSDSVFLAALYHIMKLIVCKERIEDAFILLKYTTAAARNYKQNDSSVENIYLNIRFLFVDLLKSLEAKYEEDRNEESSKKWLDVLENTLLILAHLKGTHLLNLFSCLAKFSCALKENVELISSLQLRIFHAAKYHAAVSCNTPDFKAVYQKFCFMVAYLLKSYLVANNVALAVEVLDAAFDCMMAFVEEHSVYMQCLVTFKEIIMVLVNVDLPEIASRCTSCSNRVGKLVSTNGHNKEVVNIMLMSATKVVLDVVGYVWDGLSESKWNSVFDVPMQTQLFYLFLSISQELGENKDDCQHLQLAVCLDTIVVHCVAKSAYHQTPSFEMLVPQVITVMNKCVDGLVKLKTKDPCWATGWKRVAVDCYRLAHFCCKCELFYLVQDLIIPLYKGMILLEESHVEPKCFEDCFCRTVDTLATACLGMKKPKRALMACALGIVSTPELQSMMFEKWVDVKKKNVDDNIQAITVEELLTSKWLQISTIIPNVKLQDLNFYKLAVMELEAYHSTKVYLPKSIESAYREFPTSQYILHCRALYVKLYCMWQSEGIQLCDEAIEQCNDAIYRLKTAQHACPVSERQLHLLFLGQMHFCLFLHNLKKTHAKQKEEVESMPVIPSRKMQASKIGHDPDDVCEAIPAYASITVVKEQGVLHYLNQALSFWTEALSYETALHEDVNIATHLGNLKAAAFIYYMYGLQLEGLKVWGLVYKLGHTIGDRSVCFDALCHLMEVMVCENDHPKLKEMEDIVGELNMDSEYDATKRLSLYYLSRGAYFYVNKRYEEGVQFLKKMKELSAHVDTLTCVQYKILAAKYILLWPVVVTADELGELSVLFTMKTAVDYINAYVTLYLPKEGNIYTYYRALYLLFEASLFRGRTFRKLCSPREARAYLEDNLILAQKLALSTRTTQYLSLLAQVDILCGAVNDAHVKVRDMKYILSLPEQSSQEMFSPTKDQLAGTNELTVLFSDLTLDVGNKKECWLDCGYTDSTGGSPVLQKAPFLLPKFVSHTECCDCVWCTNLDAQQLSLVVAVLEAVLHYYRDDKKTALSFFKGALRLSEELTAKQAIFIERSTKLLPFPEQMCKCLALSASESFNVSKIRLMLHFSDILCSQGLFSMAQQFNEHACTLLTSVDDKLLWCEVQHQQTDLLVMLTEMNILKKMDSPEVEILYECEDENSRLPCEFKTPVCKSKQTIRSRLFHRAQNMPESNFDSVSLALQIKPPDFTVIDDDSNNCQSQLEYAMKTSISSQKCTPRNQRVQKVTTDLEDDVFYSGSKTPACKTLNKGLSKTGRKCKTTAPVTTDPKGLQSPKTRRKCKNSAVVTTGLRSARKPAVFIYVDPSDDSPEESFKTQEQGGQVSRRTRAIAKEIVPKYKKRLSRSAETPTPLSNQKVQAPVPSASAVKGRKTRNKGLKKCPFILD